MTCLISYDLSHILWLVLYPMTCLISYDFLILYYLSPPIWTEVAQQGNIVTP
jgi:hypothetical protein